MSDNRGIILKLTKEELDTIMRDEAKKRGLVPSDMEIMPKNLSIYLSGGQIQFFIPVKPKS